MNDVLIVMIKELNEFWRARGGMRSRVASFLPIFFIFGVFWPLQGREAWVSVPFLPGLLFMLLPLTLAGGTAADSFAGERERHTLETLLSTRLSDRDIFAGKVLATTL
jgi:ABC-2 type transport system permease protein